MAIWPIDYSTSTLTPGITAADQAIMSAATVGTGTSSVRDYYFQRNDPLNPSQDFNSAAQSPSAPWSNVKLFNELVARGSVTQPGYSAAFTSALPGAKYPGPTWTQIMLEIADYIRGVNAVDPAPSPFAPFAPGDANQVGRGFVEPLTTTYGSGASALTLRGIGRCPTLSSLTLVIYVCGFQYKDSTGKSQTIDYEANPDTTGSDWKMHFAVGAQNNLWPNVTGELVRAFVVPCTFQPGCAYPEVSDACKIQIVGLDGIQITSGGQTSNFQFAHTATSRLLSDALTVLPADRAWGGNEGPAAWRAASLDAAVSPPAGTAWTGYPFAGTQPFVIPLKAAPIMSPPVDTRTGGPSLPASWARALTFKGVTGLTVNIQDKNGTTLQTLTLNMPAFSVHAPTVNGECDHYDDSTATNPDPNWATSTSTLVQPSYYMNLRNRALTTQLGRALLIQAGDISRMVEASADLRVIAGLSNVPAGDFTAPAIYQSVSPNLQGGSHYQNIRFPDGTSACFAPLDPTGASANDNCRPIGSATYSKAILPLITATDWESGSAVPYYQFTSPACSVPTGTNGVAMSTGTLGDWDTGPGIAPDGAQINLADGGTTLAPATAYFSLTGGNVGATTQRTPNALVPSPVIFGSLPAGINPADSAPSPSTIQSISWRTLLFCPFPSANNPANPTVIHPGAVSPPDHLILDNFWMPVVEPYPISTCMATSGKINLNDQIAPFTYLHRSTALRALLDDLRIPAIPLSSASIYKTVTSTSSPMSTIWNAVDKDSTVAQIENKFAGGSVDAYLSESEICTVPLVPQGQASTSVSATQAALATFWSTGGGQLTGDNLRELPYAQLYGRLTTRSNSYTVHVRVQVLKKLTQDPHQDVWNEGSDVVLGDWRGSYEIERYLDPAAPAPAAGSQLGPYKFRVVSARAFTP